jgi:SAM-dependent methyltransferase
MSKPLQTRELYFMDDPREGDRLDKKVNATEFVTKYLKSYLSDVVNQRILEAGSGSGAIIKALGEEYADHSFIGIDISEDRINQANAKIRNQNNVKAIKANIYQLPFPDNHFDFIYSRFLYEYLQQPLEATQELFRVCKPGGKLLLQDLDGQFTQYPEGSTELTEVLAFLRNQTGFDPNVGRKLFNFGKTAGFNFLNAEIEVYHKKFGILDSYNYELWALKLDIAIGYLKQELPNANSLENLKNQFLTSLRDENTILFSNLITVTFEKAKL